MKQIKAVKILFGLILCGAIAGQAQATIIQANLSTTFSGTSPVGSAPWVTATLDDGGSAGAVTLTISTAGLSGTENVSGFYLNLDPALNATSLTFNYVGSSTGPAATSIQTGTNSFKADGDGYYDILFNFPTGSGFNAGQFVTYTIGGISTLTANSFNYSSNCTQGCGTGTYYAAAHAQNTGVGGSGSGWIGASTQMTPVPLPAAAWLLGSGLVGLLGLGSRRKR